jgi:hypothetical protein
MKNIISAFGAVSVFVVVSGSVAAERAEMETVLPPMVVAGLTEDQPWQYARSDDWELLTLCRETLTARFVAANTRSRLFVPEDFQSSGSRPLRFLIFDQPFANDAPPPSATKALSPEELGDGWHVVTNWVGEIDEIVAVNLFGVRELPELSMGFFRYYLNNVRPDTPGWFREGIMGRHGALAGLASYDKSWRMTRLRAFAWDDVEKVRMHLKTSTDGHGLFPLKLLFESPPPEDPDLRWRWRLQAALFCRWQIYSAEGQREGGHGFWNWARLARKGPVDEEMFKRCLGMSYAVAESRMLKYLDRFLGVSHDVPIRLYPLSEELELRPATDTEIARLLGAFQWQEAKRQREEGGEEQATRYEAAARATYARGIRRTGGDVALHGGLGLLEYESGDLAAARPHLERALAGKGAEVPALLALARLRLAEVRQSADGKGRLNADQIGFVLTPLFAARAMVPVEVEMYRLIGEVWALSAVAPEARHLNVLLEGVSNFPHDLDLAYQVAEVHARFGHREIARAVAQRAEKLSGRSPQRARFETLLAGLARP